MGIHDDEDNILLGVGLGLAEVSLLGDDGIIGDVVDTFSGGLFGSGGGKF